MATTTRTKSKSKHASKSGGKAPTSKRPSRARSASEGKAAKGASASDDKGAAKVPRVFAMSFASVYPLYVQKAAKKGRTQAEVDEVIAWLTGYRGARLKKVIDDKVDFTGFFGGAPRWNPKAKQITGVVCGVRVEEVADPLMQKIRYLDKLVDELARGKSMASILRDE